MVDNSSSGKGFIQKIKSLFNKNDEKRKSNNDELNNLLEAFRATTPKNERIIKTGMKDIIRKYTPFGIAKIDGRKLEIEYFDIRLIDILKRFKIIPLYQNNSENAIVGFYIINVNALKASDFSTVSLNGKDVRVCTLSALILKEVERGAMREEDKITIDTVCSLVEEALKK